ncbi:sigma-54-dependent Fis family transcriptional regulator [Paraburkholderia phytofirmans]|uniref:sigma-54-dependent Fis family transcriptional regulator n=1 Tax=Paraburkholderia phytofirmans TaxID=261302 RepID=UPI000AE5BAB3|nr:sigma-54-dependent Fis family transcriptional regulator [Paraburkholderia phytofirmans]
MTIVALDQLGSTDYARSVERTWERFISDRPIDDGAIREVVLKSWQRCQAFGVDPAQRTASANANKIYVQQGGWLNASVRAGLDDIASCLAETRSVAVVGDLSGTIFSVAGDRDLAEVLAFSSGIFAGANLSEHYGGTNAVGTALALGGPVTILGGEHFCQTGKAWNCSATVIRDPVDQSVIGVVDITNSATTPPMLTCACVTTLVERIQSHLVHQELFGRTRLIEGFFEQRHRSDEIVAFDRRGRIVKSTPGAKIDGFALREEEQIPGLDRDSIERWNFERLPNWIRPEYLSPVEMNGVLFGGIVRIPYGGPRRASAPPAIKTLSSGLRQLAEASPSLLAILVQAEQIASKRLPVLLQGETGTGKDVLAKAIHEASSVSAGPFVAVNCAALPRELIAGELFGHAEGAFTGARRGGAKGRFEEANGGTIFLDEIGDMPIDLQPYLLRVLEEGATSRLGESIQRRINVRVIAATNRPLEYDVAEGQFRSDLFYRLDGICFHLPPLRERSGDIPSIVRSILRTLTPAAETPPEVGTDLLEILSAHDWPGNIRELRNVLARIIALSDDELLDARVLQGRLGPRATTRRPESNGHMLSNVRENERKLILDAVAATGGSATDAAKAIGISRATIYRRLKSYRAAHKL